MSSSYLLQRLPRYSMDFVNRTLPQPHLPKRSPVDENHVLRLRKKSGSCEIDRLDGEKGVMYTRLKKDQ